MLRRLVVFTSMVVAVSAGLLVLGGATARTQDTPEFRTGTAVVLLDVIARDKKGRPIPDLKPEELQVFENDQRCEVQSFRLVEGMAGRAAAPTADTTGVPSQAEPGTARPEGERGPLNLVTMVFEGLDVEANRLASKAAKDFVERGMDERTQVAVFMLARGLVALQPYTNDKQLLIAAIDEATSGTNLKERSLADAAHRASRDAAITSGYPVAASAGAPGEAAEASGERAVSGRAQGPGAAAATGAAAAAIEGPAAVERKRREVVSNALRMADSLQRQAEGNWTLYPLLALVKAQAALQGRKTLLYFSSGILVPPNLEDVFKTIVSEANRSNVSVYSVDARGLTARGDINSSAAALRDAATTSMQQQMKGAGEATTVGEMQIMDTVDTSLRSNAQQTLSDLAEGTGGFLVANANDFGKAVDHVAADIRGYYEVTYAPALATFDGSYRRITVKVARRDVVLQTRRGYFALPPTETIVLPYEIPLVAALQAGAPRQDFELAAGALRFAPGTEGTETAVIVEVPLAPFDFTVDNKKKTFALRLSTLAVVKDAEGRVVERFSDEYPLAGPLDALADLKRSNAVLRRTVSLMPGVYTLETVAQAKESGKTSVRKTQFEVPESSEGPRLSSLCVLRRADPLPAGAPAVSDPFRVETNRLVPILDARVSKAAMPNLSFFARVYPVAEAGPATLTLDFVRDGKVVGRAKPETPPAGADGRIAFVQGVPSASLPPGQYEVRLSVEQDGMRTTEMTRFELLP
jgi:VWFA-related protein